jgi:HTH-type transcriptional regulator/antitoxin HigA
LEIWILNLIKTEADYEAALHEVEHLFDSFPNTPEGDRLEALTTLIKTYEKNRYSIPAPDPIETSSITWKAGGSLVVILNPTLAAVLESLRY